MKPFNFNPHSTAIALAIIIGIIAWTGKLDPKEILISLVSGYFGYVSKED